MPLAPRTSQGKARARKASGSGGQQGSSSGAGAGAQEMPRPQWLRTLPVMEHVPEDYGDAPDEHGIAPATYQALERHLPSALRAASRDRKLAVMRRLLQGIYPLRSMSDWHQGYRVYMESIQSSYKIFTNFLYPELGASLLDSHYSFVAGFTKDQGEGFHVDDSEVTLAACVSNEFTGGDMYFRGIRCMNHVAASKTHNQIGETSCPSPELIEALCRWKKL